MDSKLSIAHQLIERYGLEAHPEGGWFRRLYTSSATVRTPVGERPAVTGILYFLCAGERSRWHRLRSTERWYFHAGGPLRLHQLVDGTRVSCLIGSPVDGTSTRCLKAGREQSTQPCASCSREQALRRHAVPVEPVHTVPPLTWFAADLQPGEPWVLVSCTVDPGFSFEDFELASAKSLRAEGYDPDLPHIADFL